MYMTLPPPENLICGALEVIELENEIIDLKANEAREIEKILIASATSPSICSRPA